MKDGLKITKQMEKGDKFIPMEMFMKEIGRRTCKMDMEFIVIWMERGMKVIGKMTNRMDKELKLTPMDQNTKDSMN